MNVKFYPFLRGIASYLLPKYFFYRPGSGGTFSSEYCYSVWHRHLNYLIGNGLFNSVNEIKKIAEIGPGDSLGIGICGLYSGANKYYAFDVIEHANFAKNSSMNEELRDYFINNEDIPNTHRQRFTAPVLSNYNFPKEILNFKSDDYKEKFLEIEKALKNDQNKLVEIQYIVPWMNSKRIDLQGIDLIFSQAVMEHVSDIEYAYKEMYKWLRKGGVISHQIDFETHEMTRDWNGHWFIGEKLWALLARGRKYPMNRLPLSSHIKMIENAGFKIKFILPMLKENTHKNVFPSIKGVSFNDQDLITSGALIQAVKE